MAEIPIEGGAQTANQDPEFDPKVHPSELPRLLLMNARQLDREICRELVRRPETYQWQFVQDLSRAEKGGPVGFLSPFKKYIELKGRLLRFPGKTVAGLLRERLNDGGRAICQTIAYCKNKARFTNAKSQSDALDAESAWVAEEAYERMKEEYPDLAEAAEEVVGTMIDEIADYLFPGVIAVKMFKYGLDDLCPCCKVCNGSGTLEGGVPCEPCTGSGLDSNHFPALPPPST